MTQKIKVQDGRIEYSATSPSDQIEIDVAGSMNVTHYLNVGNELGTDGEITTDPGADLKLKAGTGGNIQVIPDGGRIVLDGTIWPDGTVEAVPGMVMGVSAPGELQFYSIIVGTAITNTETSASLNIAFPGAVTGQIVLGPTVMYYATGAGNWRVISAPPV